MIRKEVLDKALDITTGGRQEMHGDPSDTFNHIAELWTAYLGTGVDSEDVCHMMTLLKIGRMRYGKLNADDYVDAIGYQSIAAELAGANVK